jgi:hypothetical protein
MSKRRYDSRRRIAALGLTPLKPVEKDSSLSWGNYLGEIEEQYYCQCPDCSSHDDDLRPVHLTHEHKPTGPCLDALLCGGTISMIDFQRLFGLGRQHFLHLPLAKSSGRQRVYDSMAFSVALDRVLTSHRWPSFRKKRQILFNLRTRLRRKVKRRSKVFQTLNRVISKHLDSEKFS